MSDIRDTPGSESHHQPRHFQIHWIGMLFAALFIFARVLPLWRNADSHSAYDFSYQIGSIVGALLFGLLFACLAHKLSRRSNTVGNVVFCVTLIMASTAAHSRQQVMADDNQRAFHALNKANDADLERARLNIRNGTDVSPAIARRMLDRIDKATDTMTGDDKAMTEAMHTHMERLVGAHSSIDLATRAFLEAGGLQATDLSSIEELHTRRSRLKDLESAIHAARDVFDASEEALRSACILRRVPRSTADDFARNTVSSWMQGGMGDLIDARLSSAAATTDVLNFLISRWGDWTTEPATNTFVFQSELDSHQYEDLIQALNAAYTAEDQQRTRVLNASR